MFTKPYTLTVLLEYIILFQFQSQWKYKANIWKQLPILGLTLYLMFKPS